MRIRPSAFVAASSLAVLAVSTSVWADTNFTNAPNGAHYRQGSVEPVCTISGLNVSCTGTEIAGVGNTDADLVLSVSYSATVDCTNRGGKLVPVKTRITTASSNDEDTDVRNGTLFVSAINVSNPPTEQAFKDAATCPNGNWTKSMPAGSPTVSGFTYTLTFDGLNAPVVIIVFPAS
ncbi:hypothetical protein [Ramlibacter sp. Leaf400]|uniref:hypothetical protein n=1 Tax=Ramlibacter sp. Leaf400 TaxID=1736365 RepID=UPI0006F6849A|nr:hypothetical protein [Ramlibacter sp. Leaf400]KQT10877.1 hypothetical protein ASG30_08710 [Ramlibacter sp. Leaf400]